MTQKIDNNFKNELDDLININICNTCKFFSIKDKKYICSYTRKDKLNDKICMLEASELGFIL